MSTPKVEEKKLNIMNALTESINIALIIEPSLGSSGNIKNFLNKKFKKANQVFF